MKIKHSQAYWRLVNSLIINNKQNYKYINQKYSFADILVYIGYYRISVIYVKIKHCSVFTACIKYKWFLLKLLKWLSKATSDFLLFFCLMNIYDAAGLRCCHFKTWRTDNMFWHICISLNSSGSP